MAIKGIEQQQIAQRLAQKTEKTRVNVRSLNEECGIFGVWGRQDAHNSLITVCMLCNIVVKKVQALFPTTMVISGRNVVWGY